MQEFNEIEAIWAKHTVEVKISAADMLKQAKKEVKSIRNKSLLNIFGMALSFFAIIAVWLFLSFQSWTTYLGISIFMGTVGVYTVILYNNYRIIAKNDFTLDPNQFIEQLKRYQTNRIALYSNLYWVYAFVLSLATGLFFIEVLANFELWLKTTVISVTFIWIVFSSTYLRKAFIKKDKEKVNLLMEKLGRLKQQFVNEHD